MSYNGSGTFQINTTGQPVVAGTVISSTAFNALTADLATGLSTAITKDGQTATTARIPFAAGISSTLVTDSTSTSTGSIITAGGIGVAKAAFIGTTLNVASTTTLTGVATLTANPVLSAGTANGVTYLNGSKSLTSGSAITFDGTDFATTGTATATKLIPTGTSVTGNGLYLPAANSLGLSTNGTNAVYIDSNQNVGIGTSSPDGKFTVNAGSNTASFDISASGNTVQAANIVSVSTGARKALSGMQGLVGSSDISNYQGSLAFLTTPSAGSLTERMRIDSSGNVGIGTTSLASPNIRVNQKFAVVTAGSGVYGGQSITSYTGTSAGNQPINDIQRSRGTTDGSMTAVASGDGLGVFNFRGADGTNFIEAAQISAAVDGTVATNGMPGRLVFGTTASGASAVSERMRIDSSGNVQVQAGAVMPYAPAPTGIAAATTLTNAQIQGQIISATGTTYTITMPLGSTLETLATWATTNIAYDFYVINTASGTITIGANSNTTLGSLTIATGVSAQFRIRRTAANAFTIYRLG